jgi:hypothetical protein
MMPGERAALEGVLSALQPSLSIEIGVDKGGSLEAISARSEVVHAFDLFRHADVTLERFHNVVFHAGDSHELLPTVLAELAAAGENVDFAFVDGDHTAVGVQRDLRDLLSSPSVGRTVILIHDTLNERVRAGLEGIDYGAFDKVRLVDLDFVQGRALREKNELWAGLGVVVTGWEPGPRVGPSVYTAPDVYANFAGAAHANYGQLMELECELAAQREVVKLMERSWSWRITSPLRRLRRGASRREQ